MHPTAAELIEAVREHLEAKVLPTITDPQLRFQTLVAAHVLGVIEREMTVGAAQATDEWAALTTLLARDEARPASDALLQARVAALNSDLCGAIERGEFDTEPAALVAFLEAQTEAALALWNPDFLRRVRATPPP